MFFYHIRTSIPFSCLLTPFAGPASPFGQVDARLRYMQMVAVPSTSGAHAVPVAKCADLLTVARPALERWTERRKASESVWGRFRRTWNCVILDRRRTVLGRTAGWVGRRPSPAPITVTFPGQLTLGRRSDMLNISSEFRDEMGSSMDVCSAIVMYHSGRSLKIMLSRSCNAV